MRQLNTYVSCRANLHLRAAKAVSPLQQPCSELFSQPTQLLPSQGFRKTDPDRWEFANEFFVRNRKDLLRGIHRRKTANQPVPGQPDGQQQQLVAAVTGGNSAIEVSSALALHCPAPLCGRENCPGNQSAEWAAFAASRSASACSLLR